MARGNTRARRSNTKLLLTIGLILVAGVALVTTLVLVDAIRLPFFQKPAMAAGEKGKDHGKNIPVPVCAQAIPEFNAVQPQDLTDTQTKTIKFVWIDPDKAKQQGFFTQYGEIVGRVLKHDKSPGYAFTEADFYPKGSAATPANAVEEGMRGVYVDPAKISGLAELKRGDIFDLMAVKSGVKDPNNKEQGSIASSLVSGGKVIMAMRKPENGRPKQGELMFVQVSPQEMVDLESALATGARISCAAHPGIAGLRTERLPIPTPAPSPDVIEILSGKSGTRRQEIPATPQAVESASNSDSAPGGTRPEQPLLAEPKKKGVQQGER